MASGKENGDLQKRLLAIFRVEAAEHLKALSEHLLALEHSSGPGERAAVIETLFREAHSLKGAARAVNLYVVENACKTLETAFGARKAQAVDAISPSWFETVYRAVDVLETALSETDGEPQEPAEDPLPHFAAPDAPRAETPRPVHVEAHASTAERTLPPTGDSVRISTERLSALQVQAEELIAFKSGAVHVVGELRALGSEVAQWRKAWGRTARDARAVRRGREKRDGVEGNARRTPIDKLLDAIERDEAATRSFVERLAALEHVAERERRRLSGVVDNLQGDMRRALMQPFASLLELIPKMVRDLARDSGKMVDVRIEGASIQIDRGILEQMKDPLIHLVRNAVDHGIEAPEARRSAGKPLPARIAISVAPKEGNRVELVIADDGVGVDLEKVVAAAAKLGLVGVDLAQPSSREAALAMMFESGVTTRPIITDLSGQGLGLAIVREKVEVLGGSVAAELPATGGTLFRIVLPTTLATFRGVLVEVGGRGRQFVLPSRSVERVLRIETESVKTVESRPAVEIGGQAVALVRLSDVLGLPPGAPDGKYLQLAVVEGAGRRIAFAVDAILDDLEVLVKGLGPQLRRVPNVAGATVLGAGRVVPILNVTDLLKSALRTPPQMTTQAAADSMQQPKSLLVVEDSVTARALLRSILESAGYRVETAVDGVAALAALRNAPFDLVVSDVEMPRMDGFDLTARIRADPKLAALPVVLVTALESREDKERGIEVGANAYIVKSSFDQSNLFAVIRRLL